MTERRITKEGHEIGVGQDLLKALGLSGSLRHGKDDGEPDLFFSNHGKTIGIEVATAYYGSHQAHAEWSPGGGRWTINNGNALMLQSVQRELNDKCDKTYSKADGLWLCIELRATFADITEVEEMIKHLELKADHPYQRIILLFYPHARAGGGTRTFDLFPCEAALSSN
jgi:hypothetical protein